MVLASLVAGAVAGVVIVQPVYPVASEERALGAMKTTGRCHATVTSPLHAPYDVLHVYASVLAASNDLAEHPALRQAACQFLKPRACDLTGARPLLRTVGGHCCGPGDVLSHWLEGPVVL
jgi:hypothetical protein